MIQTVCSYTPYRLTPSYSIAETDTLDLVTDRGATTTNNITVGSAPTTGTNTLVGTEIKIVGNKIETVNPNANINQNLQALVL